MCFSNDNNPTMVIYYHWLEHKTPENCVTATHQSLDYPEQHPTIKICERLIVNSFSQEQLTLIFWMKRLTFRGLNIEEQRKKNIYRRKTNSVKFIAIEKINARETNTKEELLFVKCVRNRNIIAPSTKSVTDNTRVRTLRKTICHFHERGNQTL